MIKVSVIVPVYNVELYLKECLDSIINQTLKDVEIICIDDCSTDNSYSILEEYAKKDNRVRIFRNTKNIGSGSTRNIGIKEAIGEYIGFIDSDDYISKDYFEKLYNTAKKYDSDLVNTLDIYKDIDGNISLYHANIRNIIKSKNIFNNIDNLEYNINDNNLIKYITNPSKYSILYFNWNKIYRRKFLLDNDLFFMNLKFGAEDAEFILRLVINSPKVSFNNKSQYYYRDRKDSSMEFSRINLESKINSIKNMENLINYCINKNESFLYNCYFMIKVWHPPFYLFSISDSKNKEEFYPYIYSFANKLYLEDDEDFTTGDKKEYEEYILIRGSKTYNDYLLNKDNLNINKSIFKNIINISKTLHNNHNDNRFKIFNIINENNYLFITIFGIRITIKRKISLNDKRMLKKFLKHDINKNTVLIVEYNECHGETLPGFIKYFLDLNYNVELLINSSLVEDKVLQKFNFNSIYIFSLSKNMIKKIMRKYKKVQEYEVIFVNSIMLYNNKMTSFFSDINLSNFNKNVIAVDHSILRKFDRYLDKNKIITLLPNSSNHKYVNPHYFCEKKLKNKNIITKFIFLSRNSNANRNISLLIDSFKSLINDRIYNFELIIIGDSISQCSIDIKGYENNIKLTGYLDYESMYSLIETSDFILPMLDPNIEGHNRFLEDVSGNFQLVYGFGIVPIIHNTFAKRHGLDNNNSLIYTNDVSFLENIKYAINMNNIEYRNMQEFIFKFSNYLYDKSLENLKEVIECN